MSAYTETVTLSDGRTAVFITIRSPRQRARYDHLCRLLGVQFPPDDDAGMTAADWQAMRASDYAVQDRRQAERLGF